MDVNQSSMQVWHMSAHTAQLLKATSREKGFYHPDVRALRMQLRLTLEACLLDDYSTAQAKEIEQSLWKTGFYAVIEEFRKRIKQAKDAGPPAEENLRKATAAFVKFLHEASCFYAALACKLQAAYGSVGVRLTFSDEATQAAAAEATLPARVSVQDCRISVYRCLICLGDLARYEAMVVGDSRKRDLSRAEAYYFQAIDVFPEGGNSFNQLAVLATYTEAELPAVYYYFRSLATAHPFLVARENLLLLFEHNRARYEQLPPLPAPARGQGRRARAQQRAPKAPVPALLTSLSVRFVRLHGTLFTKINLDAFDEVLGGALAELDDLLGRAHVARGGGGGGNGAGDASGRRSDVLLMQLVAMAAFAAWNMDWAPPGHKAGYSEVLQRAELRRHVLTLVFGLASRLAFAAACIGGAGGPANVCVAAAAAAQRQGRQPPDGVPPVPGLASPLLAPLSVLLQWVATHPDCLRLDDVDEAQARERTALWQALANLLLLLPRPQQHGGASMEALPEDGQLRAFAPLTAAHRGLVFGPLPRQEQGGDAALRLQRILASIHTITCAHPAASPLAASAPQLPAGHMQEEEAAAGELHRAVVRLYAEAEPPAPVLAPPGRRDGPALLEALGDDLGNRATVADPPAAAWGGAEEQAGAGVAGGQGPAGVLANGGDTDMAQAQGEDEDDEVILYRPGPASHRPADAAMPTSTPAPSAGATSNTPLHDPASVYLGVASSTPAAGGPGPAPAQHAGSAQAAAHSGAPDQAPPPAADDMISALFGAPDSPPDGQRAGAPSTHGLQTGIGLGSVSGAGAGAAGVVPGAWGMLPEEVAGQPILLPALRENAAAAAAQNAAGDGAGLLGAQAAALAAAAVAADAARREEEGTPRGHVLSGPTVLQAALAFAPAAAAAPVAGSGGIGGNAAWQQPYAGGAALSPVPSELPRPSAPLVSHQPAFPPAPAGGGSAHHAHGGPQQQQQQAHWPASVVRMPTPPPAAAGQLGTAGLLGLGDGGNAGAAGNASSLFERDPFQGQREGPSRASMDLATGISPSRAGSAGVSSSADGRPQSQMGLLPGAGEKRPLSRGAEGPASAHSVPAMHSGHGVAANQGLHPSSLYGTSSLGKGHSMPAPGDHGAQAGQHPAQPSSYLHQALLLQQQQQQQQAVANAAAAAAAQAGQPGQGFYTRDARELEAQLLVQAYAGQAAGGVPSVLGSGSLPGLPGLPNVSSLQAAGQYAAQQQQQRQRLEDARLGMFGVTPPSLLGASLGAAAPGSMWDQLAAAGGGQQGTPLGQLAGAGGGALFGASNAFAPPQQQQQQGGSYLGGLAQQPILAAGHGNALGYSSAPLQALQQAGYAGLSTTELQQRLAFLNASRGGGGAPDRSPWAGALPGQAAAMQLPPVLQQQQQQALQQGLQQAGGAGAAGAAGNAPWSWLDAFEARQKALAAEKAAAANAAAFPFPGAGGGTVKPPFGINDIYGI